MDGAPHDFRYVAAYSRRLLQRLAAIENHVMTLIRERKKTQSTVQVYISVIPVA